MDDETLDSPAATTIAEAFSQLSTPTAEVPADEMLFLVNATTVGKSDTVHETAEAAGVQTAAVATNDVAQAKTAAARQTSRGHGLAVRDPSQYGYE